MVKCLKLNGTNENGIDESTNGESVEASVRSKESEIKESKAKEAMHQKKAPDRNWTNELTYFGAEILLGRTAFGLPKSRV